MSEGVLAAEGSAPSSGERLYGESGVQASWPSTCILGRSIADHGYSERLDADVDAEVREKLGPAGLEAIKALISLQRQGFLDAIAIEDGELAFYALERDFYVAEGVNSITSPEGATSR